MRRLVRMTEPPRPGPGRVLATLAMLALAAVIAVSVVEALQTHLFDPPTTRRLP